MRSRRLTPVSAALLVASVALTSHGASAQSSPSSAPSISPLPSAAAAGDSPDVWFQAGSTLVRLDGATGAVLEKTDLTNTDCPPLARVTAPVVNIGDLAVCLTNGSNPGGACVLRHPIDGSGDTSYGLATEDVPNLFIQAIEELDDAAWIVASPYENGIPADEAGLYRLDLPTGVFERVQPRVRSVAVAGDTIGVGQDTKPGPSGKNRAALLDPVTNKLAGIKAVDFPEEVAARGAELLFSNVFSVTAQWFDTEMGKVTGSINGLNQSTGVYEILPGPGGVWMLAGREGQSAGPAFAPDRGGAVWLDDPCPSDPAVDCAIQWVGLGADGAWLMVVSTLPQTGELDWANARLMQYAASTLEVVASVDLGPIVGVPAG